MVPTDPAGATDRVSDLLPGRDGVALGRYLKGLMGADAMLDILTEAFRRQARPGQLVFYGDHLPSLPRAFEAKGFTDNRTDYLIWQTEAGDGPRRDLVAHELPGAILRSLDALSSQHDRLSSERRRLADVPLVASARLKPEWSRRHARARTVL